MATIKWYNPDTDEWEYVGVGSSDSGGSGDVVGPSSATADTIAVFDGTTGKAIKQNTYGLTLNNNVISSSSGLDIGLSASNNLNLYSGSGVGQSVYIGGDIDGSVSIVNDNLLTNAIQERVADSGVTIDSVLIKDGLVDGKDVSTLTSNTGDVAGPSSATSLAIAVFNGTGGKMIQNTNVLVGSSSIGTTSTGTMFIGADSGSGGPTGGVVPSSIYVGNSPSTTVYVEAGQRVISESNTRTLTNKRTNPRVTSTASASSLTPDISSADQYNYTALAANLTINAPTGTPVDGNKLMFRFKDNGTSRTLTWNSAFRAIGVTIPTATTVSKTVYIGAVYNAADSKWDVIAVALEA